MTSVDDGPEAPTRPRRQAVASPSHEQLTEDTPKQHVAAADQEVARQLVTMLARLSYSAPIPPPDHMNSYERTLPGSADRILRMAEQEAQREYERAMYERRATFRLATMGQMFAFTIALAFLGVATWLVSHGFRAEGTILGTVDIVGLVTVFVTGRRTSGQSGSS